MQPSLDRADRAAKPFGHLLQRLTFDVERDQSVPVQFFQSPQAVPDLRGLFRLQELIFYFFLYCASVTLMLIAWFGYGYQYFWTDFPKFNDFSFNFFTVFPRFS